MVHPRPARNSENLHATQRTVGPRKQTGSMTGHARLVSVTNSAARRRRARANGVHFPRLASEMLKKRQRVSPAPSVQKSAAQDLVKFMLPPVVAEDVEMAEAAPKTASPAKSVPIQLTRTLERPARREVSQAQIGAVAPQLVDCPVQYVRDRLADQGPSMLSVLRGIVSQPTTYTQLPKTVSVVVNEPAGTMPSHMLGVWSPNTASSDSSKRITFFPIHNLVLAAHCANLPPIPAPIIRAPAKAGERIELPCIPLCIPAPQMFSCLAQFLYTKDSSALLTALLGQAPPVPREEDSEADMQKTQATFARTLAADQSAHDIFKRALLVNGLWRNVCALGVHDDTLWAMMTLAWDILLDSLRVATAPADSA